MHQLAHLSALLEQIAACDQLAFLLIWNIRQHEWRIRVVQFCDATPPFLVLCSYHITELAGSSHAIPPVLMSSLGVSSTSLLVLPPPASFPSPFSGCLSKRGLVLGGEWTGWSSSGWVGSEWNESDRSSAFRAGLCSLEKGNFAPSSSRPFRWCITVTIKGVSHGGKVLFLSSLPPQCWSYSVKTTVQ